MNKLYRVVGLVLLALGLVACSGSTIVGNGKITTKARTVPAFKNIRVDGPFSVMVKAGGMQTVQLTASSNILPLIVTSVTNHTLTVGFKHGTRVKLQKPVHLAITVKDLQGLSVSGNSKAQVSAIAAKTFALRSSGDAEVGLLGSAGTVSINVSGSGKINASQLKARNVVVSVSGSAEVQVFASHELKANISGSGDVTYAGKPKLVQQQSSGDGRIRPAN